MQSTDAPCRTRLRNIHRSRSAGGTCRDYRWQNPLWQSTRRFRGWFRGRETPQSPHPSNNLRACSSQPPSSSSLAHAAALQGTCCTPPTVHGSRSSALRPHGRHRGCRPPHSLLRASHSCAAGTPVYAACSATQNRVCAVHMVVRRGDPVCWWGRRRNDVGVLLAHASTLVARQKSALHRASKVRRKRLEATNHLYFCRIELHQEVQTFTCSDPQKTPKGTNFWLGDRWSFSNQTPNPTLSVDCLFLRSPSRVPYRTELIPRAPKWRCTRTPHP